MANKMKLSEIDLLLRHYRTERRVLGFQMKQTRITIKDLQKLRNAAEKEGAAKIKKLGIQKRGPGRPRKNPVPPPITEAPVRKRKRGPGRPKRKAGEAPRMNDWDKAIIAAITSKGELMTKQAIREEMRIWAKKNQSDVATSDVEVYVTRALQKLTKGYTRSLGMYHSGLRRGNHYGLIEWFFRSNGKLRPSSLNRLNLAKKD